MYQFIKGHQFEAYKNASRIATEQLDSVETHQLFCTIKMNKEF